MGRENENLPAVARSSRPEWPVRYGGSLAAVAAAVVVWSLSPFMHHEPFAIFVLAVVFTARFLGFGPAVVATVVSVVAIDYFAFEPHFSLSLQSTDVARLMIFTIISLLAASLARQRSRAEVRADQTMEQMAAIARLSPNYFAWQFTRATGLPPHQYVIARRVERAKQLLQAGSDFSLAEVAAHAGFSDQSQFSHHFKRLVGVTPGQYRMSARIT